jgi:hypothetical protein
MGPVVVAPAARLSRITVASAPHHGTQRGGRRPGRNAIPGKRGRKAGGRDRDVEIKKGNKAASPQCRWENRRKTAFPPIRSCSIGLRLEEAARALPRRVRECSGPPRPLDQP